MPEDLGQVISVYQHVWGYLKRQETAAEKSYFFHMDQYVAGRISQAVLREDVVRILTKYPNSYLENSSLINDQAPYSSRDKESIN
ncbi:DUF1722 domain-containing protein [Streptococcus anginosus]|uniref:DUF1722 domain-containing protein n=1 Tax=Streptococcus anginosus TaxID=1328 RepID=UPI00352F52E9